MLETEVVITFQPGILDVGDCFPFMGKVWVCDSLVQADKGLGCDSTGSRVHTCERRVQQTYLCLFLLQPRTIETSELKGLKPKSLKHGAHGPSHHSVHMM